MVVPTSGSTSPENAPSKPASPKGSCPPNRPCIYCKKRTHVFRFSKYSCGCSLRGGTLFIGWTCIVVGIMVSVPFIRYSPTLLKFLAEDLFPGGNARLNAELGHTPSMGKSSAIVYCSQMISFLFAEFVSATLERANMACALVILFFASITFILSGLLVLGVYTNNRYCIIPWLLASGMCCLVTVPATLIRVASVPFMVMENSPVFNLNKEIVICIGATLHACFQTYLFLIVHSHFQKMPEPPEDKDDNLPSYEEILKL